MPKIDIEKIQARPGTGYPQEYAGIVDGRSKQKLGDAGGLDQFGVNLTRLSPGAASAHRHWHESEDEFIYMLEGEAMLVEDDGETRLCAGDAAAFKAGVANGHHLVNRSGKNVVYLEIGARAQDEVCRYTDLDVDMIMIKKDGQWAPPCRKDGEQY